MGDGFAQTGGAMIDFRARIRTVVQVIPVLAERHRDGGGVFFVTAFVTRFREDGLLGDGGEAWFARAKAWRPGTESKPTEREVASVEAGIEAAFELRDEWLRTFGFPVMR